MKTIRIGEPDNPSPQGRGSTDALVWTPDQGAVICQCLASHQYGKFKMKPFKAVGQDIDTVAMDRFWKGLSQATRQPL